MQSSEIHYIYEKLLLPGHLLLADLQLRTGSPHLPAKENSQNHD